METPLKAVTTHMHPSLYEAVVAAKKAGKIPTLRKFFQGAVYDALPPSFRKGVAKP